MHRFHFVRNLLLLAAVPILGWSQDRGTIVGRVTDPSSAVIAGATVTVTNQDTGIKTTSTTNEAGNYTVRSLPFGQYEITCEAKGFRKYLHKDNAVNVGQTMTLDITLEIGAMDQMV